MLRTGPGPRAPSGLFPGSPVHYVVFLECPIDKWTPSAPTGVYFPEPITFFPRHFLLLRQQAMLSYLVIGVGYSVTTLDKKVYMPNDVCLAQARSPRPYSCPVLNVGAHWHNADYAVGCVKPDAG